MCTLVAAFGQFEGFPLVIAANRDERLDRPATPPRPWPGPTPFFAPRDEVGGGTWLGLNDRGLFVGITNRFGVKTDPTRKSRGQIVTEALKSPVAAELHLRMAELPAAEYNPFHLLYADGMDAYVTWYDGERLQQSELGTGVHVITERSLGGDDKARTELIRERWPEIARERKPPVDKLQALLRMHRESDPVGGTCVHVPQFNYGTRSSMVLLLGEKTELYWAEGTHAPFAALNVRFS